MGDWTPEPWRTDKGHIRGNSGPVIMRAHRPVSWQGVDGYQPAESMRNTERAVACVNALAGVPNPEGVPELIKAIQADYASHSWEEYVQDIHQALEACGIETSEEGGKE